MTVLTILFGYILLEAIDHEAILPFEFLDWTSNFNDSGSGVNRCTASNFEVNFLIDVALHKRHVNC